MSQALEKPPRKCYNAHKEAIGADGRCGILGSTVLLIVPDWHTRAMVYAQLQEEGYDVRASPFLDDALRRLWRGAWPDLSLIVLDISREPGHDRLKSDIQALQSIAPLVVLTGAYGPSAAELKAWGAQKVLRRPLSVGEIVAVLKRTVPPSPESDRAGPRGD